MTAHSTTDLPHAAEHPASPAGAGCEESRGSWPLERALFALAGTMTLLSVLLAATVSPWFLLLTAFVGVSQWLYVLVGACPASIVLSRAFGLRSVVYPARTTR